MLPNLVFLFFCFLPTRERGMEKEKKKRGIEMRQMFRSIVEVRDGD